MRIVIVLLALLTLCLGESAHAGAIRTGFDSTAFAANDDGSVGPIGLGFNANFFGNNYSSAWVNNNGNITFAGALSTFTPFGLTATATPIIAPFFADVDTRGIGSDLTRYGAGLVGGRNAFGVTWDGVGYFPSAVNKLNKFQLILVDRSDTGAGNFDIEFNYDQIQWETGGASGGTNGLGGSSARVGYSNGTGAPGSFFEFAGSGVNGAFLDGGPSALITNSLGASIDRGSLAGQYVFEARNGNVGVNTVPEPCSVLVWSALGLAGVFARKRASAKTVN